MRVFLHQIRVAVTAGSILIAIINIGHSSNVNKNNFNAVNAGRGMIFISLFFACLYMANSKLFLVYSRSVFYLLFPKTDLQDLHEFLCHSELVEESI